MITRLSPIVVVRQQTAPVVEFFGKYNRVMQPGFNFKWPLFEAVAFDHSLKE